jgi:hypothetical protein
VLLDIGPAAHESWTRAQAEAGADRSAAGLAPPSPLPMSLGGQDDSDDDLGMDFVATETPSVAVEPLAPQPVAVATPPAPRAARQRSKPALVIEDPWEMLDASVPAAPGQEKPLKAPRRRDEATAHVPKEAARIAHLGFELTEELERSQSQASHKRGRAQEGDVPALQTLSKPALFAANVVTSLEKDVFTDMQSQRFLYERLGRFLSANAPIALGARASFPTVDAALKLVAKQTARATAPARKPRKEVVPVPMPEPAAMEGASLVMEPMEALAPPVDDAPEPVSLFLGADSDDDDDVGVSLEPSHVLPDVGGVSFARALESQFEQQGGSLAYEDHVKAHIVSGKLAHRLRRRRSCAAPRFTLARRGWPSE